MVVMNIISREEWGAQEPTIRRYLPLPVSNVALQYWTPVAFNKKKLWEPCKTKEECMERCRVIQKMAMEWPFHQSDLNFNFLIGSDLNVYEGRGWTSLLTEDSYWDGIRIGLIGRWNTSKPAPDDMKEKAYQLVEYGKKRQYVKPDAYVFDMLYLEEDDNSLYGGSLRLNPTQDFRHSLEEANQLFCAIPVLESIIRAIDSVN